MDRLSEWAESDAPFTNMAPTVRVFAGEEAVRVSRELLAKAGVGQPNLGHVHAQGTGRSPRRQVRLPEDVNQRLDAYLAAHDTTASAVIRTAIEEYLDRAGV